MPKARPSVIDVNGLSVDEIMDMDINKLSEKDLRKVSTRLMSAANKRLKRLGQSKGGRQSPAYQAQMKRGGKFSVKGKNLQQLRQEWSNMRSFMGKKTGSLGGWNKFKREQKERLEDRTGVKMDEKQESHFWETYRKVEESHGDLRAIYGDSTRIQTYVANRIAEGKTEDEALQEVDAFLDHEYERMMQDEQEEDEEDYTEVYPGDDTPW